MVPDPLIHLVHPAPAINDSAFTGLMKRQGARRFARTRPKQSPKMGIDPYLLLLLADQELIGGREEQARYLIEAAYEFFDDKTKTSVSRLHLAG